MIEEYHNEETLTTGGQSTKRTTIHLNTHPYFVFNLICKLWQRLCTDFYLSHPNHMDWLRNTSINFLRTTQYGRALGLFRSFICQFNQLELWTCIQFVEYATEKLSER